MISSIQPEERRILPPETENQEELCENVYQHAQDAWAGDVEQLIREGLSNMLMECYGIHTMEHSRDR